MPSKVRFPHSRVSPPTLFNPRGEIDTHGSFCTSEVESHYKDYRRKPSHVGKEFVAKRFAYPNFAFDRESKAINLKVQLEVCATQFFRLWAGNTIPKSSYRLSSDGKSILILSRRLNSFRSLAEIKKATDAAGEQVAPKVLEKLEKGNNRKILAKILVTNVVLGNRDAKPDHFLFVGDGETLSFIDPMCFAWRYEHSLKREVSSFKIDPTDFDCLPELRCFRPYYFMFTDYAPHAESDEYHTNIELQTLLLRRGLGAGFTQEVYQAVLSIILTPQFLMDTFYGIFKEESASTIDLARDTVKSAIGCTFEDIIKDLSNKMTRSVGFRAFLDVLTEDKIGDIINDFCEFRQNNSDYRKASTAEAFREDCSRAVHEKLDILKALFAKGDASLSDDRVAELEASMRAFKEARDAAAASAAARAAEARSSSFSLSSLSSFDGGAASACAGGAGAAGGIRAADADNTLPTAVALL